MGDKRPDMLKQLIQMNEKSMDKLLNDFHKKRSDSTLKDDIKKEQSEPKKSSKEETPPTKEFINSSLREMLNKLLG